MCQLQRKIVRLLIIKVFSCSVSCYKTHKLVCAVSTDNKDKEDQQTKQPNTHNKLSLDDGEDIILEEDQLNLLITNDKITSKLKNRKLKRIIKLINASKFKSSLLDKILKKDVHFREFADEILVCLGFKVDSTVNL